MSYSDRRLGAVVAAAGLAAVLAACAAATDPRGNEPVASESGTAWRPDPIEALRAAAEREESQPGPHGAVSLAVPDGLDAAALAPIDPSSDAGRAAHRPTAEVIAELAGRRAFENVPQYPPPVPAVLTQAMRLYASGREKAAAGDATGATADLEQATKLDPTSAEAWRELGDAQAAAGRRLAAMGSYSRAAENGIDDARVWWTLGRDALRGGKPDLAATLLARARTIGGRASDPAVDYLIDADLGEALLTIGNLAAGIELIDRGTSLQLPPPWGTRLRHELVDLLRRRADLRQRAGDAAIRLGQTDLALACYEEAGEDGQLAALNVLARKAYALASAGRGAGAALVVVESLTGQTLPVSDGQIALVRALAVEPSIRELLGPAMDALAGRSTLPGETALKRWVRARAASRDVEEGRALLREAMVRYPEAEDLFEDLVATYPRRDAAGRVNELVRLVETSSRSASLTGRLLVTSVDATGELAALEGSGSWAAAVIRVPWLIGMGRAADAYVAAESLDRGRTGAQAAAVAAASVTAKAATGRFDTIEPDLDVIRATAGDADPLLLARALTECQRFVEAYESIAAADSAAAETWTVEQRLAASTYAVRGGRLGAAEAHAMHVLESDPFNEEAYEALAGLYSEHSPMADEQKLTKTIQTLRQAAPEGRVVRWLTAQEMVTRKMDAQAQAVLAELATGATVSEPSIAALALVLERRAALGPQAAADGEEQMRVLAERWPETPVVWAGLARVMVAAGKAPQAAAMLADRLAQRPWPALAGARETLLRDALKQPEAARAAAMERLSARPRSIESTVSYAVELARDQRLEDAAGVLRADLPAGSMLSADQQNRLGGLIAAEFAPSDRAGAMPRLKNSERAPAVAALFDALGDHGARLAPQMHQARIGVICQIRPVDILALRRACDQAARDVPAIAAAANRIAAQELVETAKSPADATAFLREALRTTAEPSTQLLIAYFAHVAEHGSASDVDSLESVVGGVPGELMVLRQVLDADKVPTDDTAIRGEFLYQFGGLATTRGRRDLAKLALRKVLEVDADHGMANNDLGYFYVEDREQPDQAEQMLVRAYKARPDSHNVADSLGWLRYRQGRLEDWRDPATGEAIPGAASLIAKASELSGGIDNSTIQDHLGDTLWRTGQREKAIGAWQRARALLERDLQAMEENLGRMGGEEAAAAWRRQVLQQAREELASVRAKLEAAAAGREPPLAEMFWRGSQE